MPPSHDEVLRVDEHLVDVQSRLNDVFRNDLLAPVYCVREPTDDMTGATISGGDSYHYYRERLTNWQGPGFLLRIYREEMTRSAMNATVLHELGHSMQTQMILPYWPPEHYVMENRKQSVKQLSPFSIVHHCRWHRADFWRLAVHLWSRGVDNGFPCRIRDLGITWIDHDLMLETLRPEIKDFADMPVWKIARRPVPRKFVKLFDVDLEDIETLIPTQAP